MLVKILRFWSQGLSAMAGGALVWSLWSVSAGIAETRHKDALASLEASIREEQQRQEAKVKEVSSDYQGKLSDLNRRLTDLRRVQQHCVPVASTPPGGHNAATPDAGLPVGNGLGSGYLLDFAGRCEQVGRQLDACQKYMETVK